MNDESGWGLDGSLPRRSSSTVATVANGRWSTKVQIAVTSVRLFVRLSASIVAAIFDGWRAKQRKVFQGLKRLFLGPSHSICSFKLSFSSLTTITHHRTKFYFIYRAIRKPIAGCRPNAKWLPKTFLEGVATVEESGGEPEPCVHVDVLHDPGMGPGLVRADVIFIHGLHGSLYNTWKQGLWSHRKQVQNLPLEHKYEVKKIADCEAVSGRCIRENNETEHWKRHVSIGHCDSNYDHLLENITDLINDIDDAIKDTKNMRDEEEPYSPCWPRDWLPKDCPGVRVLAVNYTTDPFLWRPAWVNKRIRSTISQRSQEMEDRLLELGVGRNPMIWVGHSKGGLYVKRMLIDARYSEDPQLSNFLIQTKGIMFYSVPHRGSSLANWKIPFVRQSVELMEVKKDSQNVLDLHNEFLKLFEENFLTAEVFSFVETIMTFIFMTNVKVVSVDSADLGLGSFRGVNIDHREICKPLNRDCFLYQELVSLINRVV